MNPANTCLIERASPRLPLTIPVVMRGKDSSGNTVIEKTHTVVVNVRGAKVLTSHCFTLGTPLEVAVPHLKRRSDARVAWIGPYDAEFQAIGIDLGNCEDFWGMQDMVIQQAAHGKAGDQNGKSNHRTSGTETNHTAENGRNGLHIADQHSPVHTDNFSRLSGALDDLVRTTIENALEEIIPRVVREAQEKVHSLVRTSIEQTSDRTQKVVDEGMRKLETQVAEIVTLNKNRWQQTVQEMACQTEGQLAGRLSECQDELSRKAATVRHELASKLADLSTQLKDE